MVPAPLMDIVAPLVQRIVPAWPQPSQQMPQPSRHMPQPRPSRHMPQPPLECEVRVGSRGGQVIQTYRGYGSREAVFLMGRVFRQPGLGLSLTEQRLRRALYLRAPA